MTPEEVLEHGTTDRRHRNVESARRPSRRTPRRMLAALLLALLAACTPPATRDGDPVPGASRPEEAVSRLLAALGDDDAGGAVDVTVPGQMVAVALVEGAEIDEAVALLPSGGRSVGINFWGEFARSFTEFLGAGPSEARTGEVVAFSVDGNRFARVEVTVPARGAVRTLVARRAGDGATWQVDVFASFASALAGRLPPVVAEVAGAGGRPGVDRLADLLRDLEPSLRAAAESPDAGSELRSTVDVAVAAVRGLPD